MVRTFHIDFSNAKSSKLARTPQGGLKVPARLTRIGVFKYTKADGSVIRECRKPDQVFDPVSLATFQNAPICIDHPGEVGPDNWQAVSVGHVGEDVRRDGRYVAATLVIQDAAAIRAVERGALKDLSCAYDAVVTLERGSFEGEEYDAVQSQIVGNHLALLPKGGGRAGPDCTMKLDAREATRTELAQEAARAARLQYGAEMLIRRLLEPRVDVAAAQARMNERMRGGR